MEIRGMIDRIHRETRMDIPDTSLYLGRAGLILFDYLYQKHGGTTGDLSAAIQQLAEDTAANTNPLFCGGMSGVRWLYTYLYKEGLLEEEDWRFLRGDDGTFEAGALSMLELGNYDFLHGATGIAHDLLYAGGQEAFFREFLKRVETRISKSRDGKAIESFDFERHVPKPGEVNLGLAHGLPSLLLFCVQCCRQGVRTVEASAIARMIIDYLVDHVNSDTRENFFPNLISATIDDRRSRLAWCHGDLGVGFSLYRAGQAFLDNRVRSLGWNVLVRSTYRRTQAQTHVGDACVCHGSAGIAHIYHRLWRDTGLAVFQTACEDWIERTVDYGVHPDGIGGFKTLDKQTGGYTNSPGFLEGSAGIATVLLGYMTGDIGWDHCIMLNN